MIDTRDGVLLDKAVEPGPERKVTVSEDGGLLGVFPALSVLRRVVELWPRDWKPATGEEGEWSGRWNCVSRSDDEPDQVTADVDEDYAVDLAKLIASLVNAAPVLIEIAESMLARQRAEMYLQECRLAWQASRDDAALRVARVKRDEADVRWRTALSKVRP